MTPREFLDFLGAAGKLKTAYRHNFTEEGRRESVAEHSWRLALMAMILREDFPEVDIDRVVKMCVIHDLGEAVTGDIPCFLKTEADEEVEKRAVEGLFEKLGEGAREEFSGLYSEMERLETEEARLYKALDCLEAVISHNEADISTWEPHEYELQFSHGTDKVAWSGWLRELKAEIDKDTRRKIEEADKADNLII